MWAIASNLRSWGLAAALAIVGSTAQTAARALAEAPTPDGLTVSSNQEVELCRPKGRCFIPEPDDPIFIGDVIETFAAGRFDFLLPDAARILLLKNGKIRIDRGSVQMVEIEIIGGTLVVETFASKKLDVTLGDLRCRVGAGPVALSHQLAEKPTESSSVVNGNGMATCFSTGGATHLIDPNAAVDFHDGQVESSHPIPEGFWSSISPSR